MQLICFHTDTDTSLHLKITERDQTSSLDVPAICPTDYCYHQSVDYNFVCKREPSFTWSSCSAELYSYFQSLECVPATDSCHPASRRGLRVPLYRHVILLASWRQLNLHTSVINNKCVDVWHPGNPQTHQESTTSRQEATGIAQM